MRIITGFWITFIFLLPSAAFADRESYSHEPTFYLNSGYARINPQLANETNKDAVLLGVRASYECRSVYGRFAPGLGLQFAIATGESNSLHQNFTQLSLVPDFQYGYNFFGESTTIGVELAAPMGRGAYFKYNDGDTFQVNFLAGLQMQTRWSKSWGDLIIGIGLLNSFGISNVNTWMIPLSLGFTFGGAK